MDLKTIFREVPDFPKPGINFIDITPMLLDPKAFQWTMERLAAPYQNAGINKVVGIESRGFIFGAPLALQLNAGFALIRKKGKLPAATYSHTYDLEYGSDTIEIHQDAVEAGDRVLLVDDLLATGGTTQAALSLLEKTPCHIAGTAFVVELSFLNGREKLSSYSIHSLVTYE